MKDSTAGIAALGFEDLTPRLKDALRPRYERLGYLGGFFRFAAHQPEALLAFNEFTESLKHALPPDLAEVVSLTVASRLDNRYERHQHERLALKLGLGRDLVAALVSDEVRPALLDERQAAARDVALYSVAQFGHGGNDRLAALVEIVGPDIAMAVLLLTARYVAHAVVANTLELEPPVPSIFDHADS